MDRLETVDDSVRRLVCRYKEKNMLHLAKMFVDLVCWLFKDIFLKTTRSAWRCEGTKTQSKQKKKKTGNREKGSERFMLVYLSKPLFI